MSGPRYVFVHVMRTGGTSMRHLLWSRFPQERIYPNQAVIDDRGQYPEIGEVARHPQEFFRRFHLVAGHYPARIVDLLPGSPEVLTLLRHPVARTLSHLRRAAATMPTFRGMDFHEILDGERFRAQFVENYMTRYFSFRSPTERASVNLPLPLDRSRLEDARKALDDCLWVGITEQYGRSLDLLAAVTDLELDGLRHDNRSTHRGEVDRALIRRIEELTQLDHELYEHARERFEQDLRDAGLD